MSLDDKLKQINMEAAMKRKKSLFRNEDRFGEEREVLEKIAKDKRLTIRQRDEVRRKLDNPKLYETRLVVNEKEAKQIEREVEGRIKSKMASGELPKPTRDAFIKSQLAWKKRGIKKSIARPEQG